MSGARHFAVERDRRRRAAVREFAADRRAFAERVAGALRLERAVLWFARTIGTQTAPWLLRTPDGRMFRAERVRFFGETRLLPDDERELLLDKPRGIVEAERVEAFGWEELP